MKQSFQSFELIVSDNSSEQEYKTLENYNEYPDDNRIRQIRPPTELSMSDHWEFAVGESRGKYIILFGDDDGLVANALEWINSILQTTQANVICWSRAEYSWPDRKPAGLSNQLVLSYAAKTGKVDSEKFIKKIVYEKADYRYLPMFYNSAISKQTVDQLVAETGRVFNGLSPDIYTGYAFAWLVKSFLCIGYPLSINGVSSKSNGAAHINQDKEAKSDFHELLKKSKIKWPPSLPYIITNYIGVIEPFLQLAHFYPELKDIITRKEIFKRLIDGLEARTETDLKEKIEAMKSNASDNPSLLKWFNNYIEKANIGIKAPQISDLKERVGFDGYHLTLDCSQFNVTNVDDVAGFIPKIFGEYKHGDYNNTVENNLMNRVKKAGAILLRGV